jgi:hypothetical protein
VQIKIRIASLGCSVSVMVVISATPIVAVRPGSAPMMRPTREAASA